MLFYAKKELLELFLKVFLFGFFRLVLSLWFAIKHLNILQNGVCIARK
ncbi:hypothetical protein SAMN05518872_10644 [Psychrobacillus sp. OK032]|nr:hypothetical protein SAMN05518872_10644 [Psychrobacillus sp. OK032]